MPTAQQSFILVWKRFVAALSLVAAALLAPTAPASVSGAGVTGSRAGHGQAVTSTAEHRAASLNGLVEGGERIIPLDEPGTGPQVKPPCVLTAWHEFPAPRLAAAVPAYDAGAPTPAFAPRSGLSRAPPSAGGNFGI